VTAEQQDVQALLARAVDEAARLLNADGAMVYLVDPGEDRLRFAVDAGIQNPEARQLIRDVSLPVGVGLFGHAIATGQVVVSGDYRRDRHFPHSDVTDRIAVIANMRSIAAAPLTADGQVLGALGAYSSRIDDFDEAEVALLRALADHASGAIANQRLIEQLARSREELARRVDAQRTLGQISASIAVIREPGEILHSVVEAARRLIGSDGAHLTLMLPSGQHLRPSVVVGGNAAWTEEWLATQDFPINGGINGLAAGSGAVIATDDYLVDPRIPHEPDDQEVAERMGLRGMAAAPLRSPGAEVIGTLAVSFETVHAFSDDELALLQGLADQGAIAISNARLTEDLRAQTGELAHRVDAQRTLAAMAAQLTSLRDPVEVLRQTLLEAVRLLKGDGGQIGMVGTDADGVMRWGDGHSLTRGSMTPFTRQDRTPAEHGVSGRAIRDGRATWTDDYLADESFGHDAASDEVVRRLGIRSVIATPLVAEDGAIGAIGVYAETPGSFNIVDAELLRLLADQAAIVLTNARLNAEAEVAAEKLAHRVEAQRTLGEIAASITSIRDPSAVLSRAVAEAKRLLDAEHVVIHQVRRGTRELADYREALGGRADASPIDDSIVSIGQGIAGRAVASGSVAWTGDYMSDTSFVHTKRADEWITRFGYHSQVSAPLIADSEPLGAVSAYSTRPDAFDDDDAQLLGALASQAAIVLGNARLYEELQRRVEAQRSLGEIAARITAIREPGDVLQRTLDEAVRLLDADGGRIELVAETGGLHWAFGHSAIDLPIERDERTDPVELNEGVSGRAVIERRVVLTGDYLADPDFTHAEAPDRYIRQHGIRSVMSAPLIGEDGAIGSLTVHSQARDAFDGADAELLEVLASQAAIAVTNARLYEKLGEESAALARQTDSQRRLLQINQRLLSTLEPASVLELIADGLKDVVRYDSLGVYRVADDEGVLTPVLARDRDAEAVLGFPIPRGQGLTWWCVEHREPVLLNDALSDARRIQIPGTPVEEQAIIIVPLISGDEVIGAMNLGRTGGSEVAFTDADFEMVQLFAAQAAVAITNARLYEELRERADAQRSLAEIAAQIASLRDPRAVLQRAVSDAARLLGAEGADINLLEGGAGPMSWAFGHGPFGMPATDEDANAVVRPGEGIAGAAIDRRETVWTDHYLADPSFRHVETSDAWASRYGIASAMAAPLLSELGALGTLTVYSPRPRAFGRADAELLKLLADQAAIAVINARLYEQLSERVDAQRALSEIAAQIAALHDPLTVIQRAVADAARLLSADRAQVNLAAEGGTHLERPIASAPIQPSPDDVIVPIGSGIAGMAAAERRVRWTGDYLNDEEFPHDEGDARIAAQDIHSMMAAPLLGPDRLLGTITVQTTAAHAFDAGDAELLKLLADQAAIALTNARLYAELEDSERRYRHLIDNSPDIVWSVDAEGIFTFFSDSLEPRTGWKPDQLLGQPFNIIAGEETLAAAVGAWERLKQDPDRDQRFRLDLPLPDGSIAQTEVAMTGTIVDGRFLGAVGLVRDISERERLEGDLRSQAAELAASQERAHLARELHDSVTQALFSMGLTLRTLEILLATNPEAAGEKLAELRELQKDALAEMRTLIFELRPSSLESDGLVQALRTHATAVQRRTGLTIVVDAEPIDRLPLPAEEALYRIGQEAMHNIVKHANASNAALRIFRDGGHVRLSVSDDGIGFAPDEVPRGHLGLIGMRQRVDLVGGELRVQSRTGDGTLIEASVPAGEDASDE
jgi:PAS domain S-box-containing protein